MTKSRAGFATGTSIQRTDLEVAEPDGENAERSKDELTQNELESLEKMENELLDLAKGIDCIRAKMNLK